jgi:aconitate hydratase
MPKKGEIEYSVDIDLDLATVQPSVSGPKRPQDRINLAELGQTFRGLFVKPVTEGGYGKSEELLSKRTVVSVNGSKPAGKGASEAKSGEVGHGSVLIAAITSCTNTSNPSVMLGAGLLAKKAVEKG